MAIAAHGRILVVTHAFLPDSTAGVEVYSGRLAGGLARRGFEVAIAAGRVRRGSAQNAILEEEVEGFRVFGLVQNYPYRDLPEALDDPALDRSFAEVLDRFRPDLVAFQSFQGLSLGFVEVARSQGATTVLHLHDAWWSCPSGGQRRRPDGELCHPVDRSRCRACFDRYRHREGPLEQAARWMAAHLPEGLPTDGVHRAFHDLAPGPQRWIRRLNEEGARLRTRGLRSAPLALKDRGEGCASLDPAIEARFRRVQEGLRAVDCVLAPSSFLPDSLREDGLELPPVHIVRTGVNAPAVPWQERAAGEPLRLLFLGTWVEHKGPQVLADALARLPSAVAAGLTARAVGPAPFPRFKAESLARAQGRLIDGGQVSPNEVGPLLAATDIVVVPSLWGENAPLVVLEARAHGVPVLASDLGGLPEAVIADRDGALLPAGDAPALAAAIADLVERPERLARWRSSVRPPPDQEVWLDAVLEAWGVGLSESEGTRAGTTSLGEEELLRAVCARNTAPEPAPGNPSPEISVAIPVLNGGTRLLELLDAVLDQDLRVEVLIADSGSTDGSVQEALRRHRSLRLFAVRPAEFDHGRVRTELVVKARCEYVALFTQDAVPQGRSFLRRLRAPLAEPAIVGAYARQVPRPGADPLVWAKLERWTPPALPDEDWHHKSLEPGQSWESLSPHEAMHLARFDNVASLVRRSWVLEHPFPPRTFGEDLSWGAEAIQARKSLAYVPQAQAEHHHDPSLLEAFDRNRRAHLQARAEFGLHAVPDLRSLGWAALAGMPTDLRKGGPLWALVGLPRRTAALLGQWKGARDALSGKNAARAYGVEGSR